MTHTLILITGILAPFFVVLSFILKNIRHIRIVNLIGCILFVIYGFVEGILLPIIIPNGILACIQIYYIWFAKKKESDEQRY